MYHTRTGSYDEIPEGMKRYINNYGCHFNKKLCDWAASQMYKNVNGKKQYIQPYTKEQVDMLALQEENLDLKMTIKLLNLQVERLERKNKELEMRLELLK